MAGKKKVKPKPNRTYKDVEGARYINVPVSEEVYQLVKQAAAAAIVGGMQMRYWVERSLKAQATAELGGAE